VGTEQWHEPATIDPGVAHDFSAGRARTERLLGTNLKVIYIVREPVARTFSHHRHLYHDGRIAADINQVLRSTELDCRELIEIGRYAAQIQPWLDVFGTEHVRIVQFEQYMLGEGQARRTIEDTLELGWKLLGLLPKSELTRVNRRTIDQYYSDIMEDGTHSPFI